MDSSWFCRFGLERMHMSCSYSRVLWRFSALMAFVIPVVGHAQDRGIRLGEETSSTWRFGVVVKAAASSVSGIRASFPVPMDWPEQTVKKIREEKSPSIKSVTYETLDRGVTQMIVLIPRLAAGEEASAVTVFEVVKRRIDAPSETDVYQIPKAGALSAKFLSPSPYIESRDAKIKALASELATGHQPAWDQTAAIFDWVREHVKYKFAEQIKPAVAALEDGEGDCE
jgi:transglutaminase-like putative cysteine protease